MSRRRLRHDAPDLRVRPLRHPRVDDPLRVLRVAPEVQVEHLAVVEPLARLLVDAPDGEVALHEDGGGHLQVAAVVDAGGAVQLRDQAAEVLVHQLGPAVDVHAGGEAHDRGDLVEGRAVRAQQDQGQGAWRKR